MSRNILTFDFICQGEAKDENMDDDEEEYPKFNDVYEEIIEFFQDGEGNDSDVGALNLQKRA